MRLLYEIDAELAALLEQVDEETGELTCSIEDLEALQIERDKALEGIALSIINQRREIEGVAAEITRLTERKAQAQKRIERYTNLLTEALGGEKMKTPLVSVSYRKSQAVELEPDFLTKADLYWQRIKQEPDKEKIKEALKAGQKIPGAQLVERQSTIIK